MDDIYRKTAHTKMMDRGFTISELSMARVFNSINKPLLLPHTIILISTFNIIRNVFTTVYIILFHFSLSPSRITHI